MSCTYVNQREEEAPPAGEDHETSRVTDKLRGGLAVGVEVGDDRRGDDSHNEGNHGEDTESDRVTATDGRAEVDHGIVLKSSCNEVGRVVMVRAKPGSSREHCESLTDLRQELTTNTHPIYFRACKPGRSNALRRIHTQYPPAYGMI